MSRKCRIKQSTQKKLRQCRGESLIETLAALLIATLALTMLPGAIIAAARTNAEAEKSFSVSAPSTDLGENPTISIGGVYTGEISVHKDGSGVYYYESKKAETPTGSGSTEGNANTEDTGND